VFDILLQCWRSGVTAQKRFEIFSYRLWKVFTNNEKRNVVTPMCIRHAIILRRSNQKQMRQIPCNGIMNKRFLWRCLVSLIIVHKSHRVYYFHNLSMSASQQQKPGCYRSLENIWIERINILIPSTISDDRCPLSSVCNN
jgi:hypothetical protein